MARPSVKAERTEEILIAFEQCVALYGVEGATLERLASQSGLQRSLVRHYMGNRNELIIALVNRFLTQSSVTFGELFNYLESLEGDQALQMIDMLFDTNYMNMPQTAVASALIIYSGSHLDISNFLRIWLQDIANGLTHFLKTPHKKTPNANFQE